MVRQKTANLKTAVLTSVNGPFENPWFIGIVYLQKEKEQDFQSQEEGCHKFSLPQVEVRYSVIEGDFAQDCACTELILNVKL